MDEEFIGQWERLISTANWEKGRIINGWRDELIRQGETPSSYSDEAYAVRVGGITSQHVRRLRCCWHHFGELFDQYPNLIWSHFNAAIEWQDAIEWLSRANRENWTVAEMRGKRWEIYYQANK